MRHVAKLTLHMSSTQSKIVQCSELVQDDVTNQEAWQHGRLLIVGSDHYVIDYNPPIADKVCVMCKLCKGKRCLVYRQQ